ncbi:unnamed protein product, partial [Discosporangium mesarthrocarpum]
SDVVGGGSTSGVAGSAGGDGGSVGGSGPAHSPAHSPALAAAPVLASSDAKATTYKCKERERTALRLTALKSVAQVMKGLMDASGHGHLIARDQRTRDISLKGTGVWEDDEGSGGDEEGESAALHQPEGLVEPKVEHHPNSNLKGLDNG